MRVAVAVAAACLVVAGSQGCRSSESRARCTAQVNDLRQWTRAVAAEPAGGGQVPKGPLVAIAERTQDDTMGGPTLTLAGSQAVLDGTPAADLSRPADAPVQLQSARDAANALWRQTHPGKTRPEPPLWVAFAPTDAWSNVSAAINAARQAGYARATFVFDFQTKVAPPAETAVSRAFEKAASASAASADPSAMLRAARGPSPTATITASCPAIAESVGKMAERAMGPDEKRAEFAERVPTAVETCGCNVEFDEIKAWCWNFNSRYDGTPRVSLAVPLVPKGEPGAVEISAPGTDTWASVAAAFVSAARQHRPVSFVAR